MESGLCENTTLQITLSMGLWKIVEKAKIETGKSIDQIIVELLEKYFAK